MGRLLTEEERAPAYVILDELGRADAFLVFNRVGPKYVAEESLPRRLLKPLEVLEISDSFELGGKSTMEREELVVNET